VDGGFTPAKGAVGALFLDEARLASRIDHTNVALGVVHRDVSPQNILVNVHGTSKIIDFGIAKARARSPSTPSSSRAPCGSFKSEAR
jgi:serine/threonine protein kinase